MIELKQVTKQYRQTAVLNNITLSIDEPGIYCLLGRNGAGKTTLLKSIAGYQNITKGVIKVDGRTISTSALSPGVSYIENFSKHFNLPVRRLLQAASQVNPDYELLKESFQKHPRIIIVSTHIIEEIARTIQKLIIIDKGNIRFFDTLESIHPMSLQDFFIQTVGHKGGAAK